MTDYIVLGSIGFAQLGTDDFFNCEKVETLVLQELISQNKLFKIPKKFENHCKIRMKSFQHDFGTYKELCLIYQQEFLDDIEDDEELNDKFWLWVNEMESFDFESEEMIEKCRIKHHELFPMRVVYRSKKEVNTNLKIS